VHEFVQNDGLECLVKLGRESDQNHQNHILRGSCFMRKPSVKTPSRPKWLFSHRPADAIRGRNERGYNPQRHYPMALRAAGFTGS